MEHIIQWIIDYRYWVIFPITIPEGPIISIICGSLLRVGVFSFWPLYLILIAGDLIGDIIWYVVGYFWGHAFIRRFGKFFSITEDSVGIVKGLFHKYHTFILFISKITTGFGFSVLTLVAAGMSHVPFRKYMLVNIIGQFIWTGMLVLIGYTLGHLYLEFEKGFGWMSGIAAVVLTAGLLYGFSKYIRNKVKARAIEGI